MNELVCIICKTTVKNFYAEFLGEPDFLLLLLTPLL